MNDVNRRFYEGMLIFLPTLSEEELEKEIGAVKEMLVKHGAEIADARVWGKRKLAYTIGKQREGTYVLFYFYAPTKALAEIRGVLKLNEQVIRELITVAEEKELSKTTV